MDKLFNAAKDVLNQWDSGLTACDQLGELLEVLRKAVELAESDEEEDRINQEAMNIHLSGVLAERKRIKAIRYCLIKIHLKTRLLKPYLHLTSTLEKDPSLVLYKIETRILTLLFRTSNRFQIYSLQFFQCLT